jgi:hypothetical protein
MVHFVSPSLPTPMTDVCPPDEDAYTGAAPVTREGFTAPGGVHWGGFTRAHPMCWICARASYTSALHVLRPSSLRWTTRRERLRWLASSRWGERGRLNDGALIRLRGPETDHARALPPGARTSGP